MTTDEQLSINLKDNLSRAGYIIKSNDYYKIIRGQYKDYIGIKIGEFHHSCHVDCSDIIVLIVFDLGDIHSIICWEDNDCVKL